MIMGKAMNKTEHAVMPLGMLGAVSYVLHTLIGEFLRPDYNPITTDISSLTALGAPNRELLLVFTTVYGISTLLFIVGMMVKSRRQYHQAVQSGWTILLIMNLVSLFGYALFPLTGDKTEMNPSNIMHLIVTVIVVITTIAGSFILAYGYLRQEKLRGIGNFSLLMAILLTMTGALNPIGMANHLNILGLTERAVIYSLQGMMFVFSAYYTFSKTEKIS